MPAPVFQRVMVDNIVLGQARVSWELDRHFVDPGPYTFQLQLGHTGVSEADDWEDVGTPVVDTYYAFDTDQRVWGKTLDPHYRVKMTTSIDTYYSEPEGCDGQLIKRDWLNAREIVRKELLRHSVLTSPSGYLLKARRYGPRCPTCADQFTEEVSRSQCTDCFGTGFEFGYFDPMPACYADVGMNQSRDHRDPNKGMDSKDVIEARFIGDPQLYSYDVWVNSTSDERYYLQNVAIAAQIRGVGITYTAELRLAPFSDVIYTLIIESEFTRTRSVQLNRKPLWPAQKKPALNYLAVAAAELKARRTHSSRR